MQIFTLILRFKLSWLFWKRKCDIDPYLKLVRDYERLMNKISFCPHTTNIVVVIAGLSQQLLKKCF